jgi:hypothetical protein
MHSQPIPSIARLLEGQKSIVRSEYMSISLEFILSIFILPCHSFSTDFFFSFIETQQTTGNTNHTTMAFGEYSFFFSLGTVLSTLWIAL